MSYSTKVIVDKATTVLYVESKLVGGDNVYFYLALPFSKVDDFFAAAYKKLFRPEDHGKILARGRGYPSETTQNYMEETYGVDHPSHLKANNKAVTAEVIQNKAH